MPTVIIIVVALIVLAALFGGKGKRAPQAPHRIDRPHVIDPDDHECSVCGRRFRENTMKCPHCGARLVSRVTNEDEFDDYWI